jgi:N-acetylglucosaminyldiphosphoundecaprenol N-acetyl-beta-D-mannosaminyltransferase
MLRRRSLFGFEFVDAARCADVVSDLLANSGDERADRLPVVVTPNVDHIVHLLRDTDRSARDLTERARWVLPDGQPIVWASRLLGARLTARLAGSDLVEELWPVLRRSGEHVIVIASSDPIAAAVMASNERATAIVAPQIQEDPSAAGRLAEECLRAARERPDERVRFVFVALGMGSATPIIHELVDRWEPPTPVMLGVGASFEMLFGMRKRAPRWTARVGLEWFYRFAQEPRRLFRRYFVDDLAFVPIVWSEYRSLRRRDRQSPSGTTATGVGDS